MPYEWLHVKGAEADLPQGGAPLGDLVVADRQIKPRPGETLIINSLAGALGAVTQITSITTGVTLAALAGEITTFALALAAAAEAEFVVTNSKVGASDVVVLNVVSGPADNEHVVPHVTAIANGSFSIAISNLGAAQADGAMVIRFLVLKAGVG